MTRKENTAKQLARLDLTIVDLYEKQKQGGSNSGKGAVYNQPFQIRSIKLDSFLVSMVVRSYNGSSKQNSSLITTTHQRINAYT